MAKRYKITEIFSNNIGVVRSIPMKKKEFENFIFAACHSKNVSQVVLFKKKGCVITYATECSNNLREYYEHDTRVIALWDVKEPIYK